MVYSGSRQRIIPVTKVGDKPYGPERDDRWKAYSPSARKGLLGKFSRIKDETQLFRFVQIYGLLNEVVVDDPSDILDQASEFRKVLNLWHFLESGVPDKLESRIGLKTGSVEIPNPTNPEFQAFTTKRYQVPIGNKGKYQEVSVHNEGGAIACIRQDILGRINEALVYNVAPAVQIENDSFHLNFQPKNLVGYLWLELAHLVARHKELKVCAGCKRTFWLNPCERRDRLYCNLNCKQNAKRAQRAKREEAGSLPHTKTSATNSVA